MCSIVSARSSDDGEERRERGVGGDICVLFRVTLVGIWTWQLSKQQQQQR